MYSIPSRSRLLSTASRRDLALKRYGRGANLVAMTGVPSKPPSRNISPMILSEAPLPYISAVSTRVTPSAMLARKASPTSRRLYSLPYPQSLVVPHAQAPTPRGETFISSARAMSSSLCKASPLMPSPRYLDERGVSAHSWCGMVPEAMPSHHYDPTKTIAKSRIDESSPDHCRIRLLASRASENSSEVDIDHVVPLANAWRSGASSAGWSTSDREAYANDPEVLLSTDAGTNRS